MATIEIKGSVATATIAKSDRLAGVLRFACSQGAWCLRVSDTEREHETLAGVIHAAEIHVDLVEIQTTDEAPIWKPGRV
jgi:hypothetical protein